MTLRWHNHLDPEVAKGPLTPNEERELFAAHRQYGNKWAEIAKHIKGRTDNVVKNHFYSTLRRELRHVVRQLKGDANAEPSEVSVAYVHQVVRENNVDYRDLENGNIRNLLIHLDEQQRLKRALPSTLAPPAPELKYSL